MHSLKRFCAASISRGPVKSSFEYFYVIYTTFADALVVAFQLNRRTHVVRRRVKVNINSDQFPFTLRFAV